MGGGCEGESILCETSKPVMCWENECSSQVRSEKMYHVIPGMQDVYGDFGKFVRHEGGTPWSFDDGGGSTSPAERLNSEKRVLMGELEINTQLIKSMWDGDGTPVSSAYIGTAEEPVSDSHWVRATLVSMQRFF